MWCVQRDFAVHVVPWVSRSPLRNVKGLLGNLFHAAEHVTVYLGVAITTERGCWHQSLRVVSHDRWCLAPYYPASVRLFSFPRTQLWTVHWRCGMERADKVREGQWRAYVFLLFSLGVRWDRSGTRASKACSWRHRGARWRLFAGACAAITRTSGDSCGTKLLNRLYKTALWGNQSVRREEKSANLPRRIQTREKGNESIRKWVRQPYHFDASQRSENWRSYDRHNRSRKFSQSARVCKELTSYVTESSVLCLLPLHNIDFCMLIEEQESEHRKAHAASIDFMLSNLPYNIMRVRGNENPTTIFLLQLRWRPWSRFSMPCYGLELGRGHLLKLISLCTAIQGTFQRSTLYRSAKCKGGHSSEWFWLWSRRKGDRGIWSGIGFHLIKRLLLIITILYMQQALHSILTLLKEPTPG